LYITNKTEETVKKERLENQAFKTLCSLEFKDPLGEEIYVERKSIETALSHFLDSKPSQVYVVVGEKQMGKTTSVQKALIGRKGVVYVKPINPASLPMDICQSLGIEEANFGLNSIKLILDLKNAFDLLNEIFERLKLERSDIIPTLVIDDLVTTTFFPTEENIKIVNELVTAARYICADEKLCRVIITVSDGTAAAFLPQGFYPFIYSFS